MANIGLTEQEFTTFCYGALFIIEQFYKDPANKAAFEKWNAERSKESRKETGHGQRKARCSGADE